MGKTIYYGGRILTMSDPLYAEAVLVENGVIRAVGNEEDVMKHQDVSTRMVDLMGRCLMPAFLDSHSHITALASTMGLVPLAELTDMESVCARLEDYRVKHQVKDREWIIGFGYDHNFFPDGRQPDKSDLDCFSRNPVLISHASGHMGVVNSMGLQMLGITKDTPDPEGGRIGRMSEKEGGVSGYGEPDGYLEESAFIGRAGSMLAPDPEKELEGIRKAQVVYLSHGITTIQDGLMKEDGFRLLARAGEEGILLADIVGYPDLKNAKELAEQHDYVKQYRNHLKIGGYKIILDGSPQGRTAWMSRPYEDAEDGYRGYPVYGDEELQRYVDTAYREDMQLLAHCNGDAAAEQFLNAAEKAAAEIPDAGGKVKDIRPVMIHAQFAREDQIRRMPEISMIPSFFAAHTYYWGDVHLKNFGQERAEHISPVKTAADSGVIYTLHQDTPVIEPDMLETVWCAVNRITKSGVRLAQEEAVSCLDALKGVTVNAAFQYHEEQEKGSIEEGKRADLIILSEDPLQVHPDRIRGITVLETIKDGEAVYRKDQ